MKYRDPGKRGYPYLVCHSGRRGMGCYSIPWRYRDFEATVLKHCDYLELASIVSPIEIDQAEECAVQALAEVRDEIARLANQEQRLVDLLLEEPQPALRARLRDTSSALERARGTEAEKQTQLHVIRANRLAAQNRPLFSELLEKLRQGNSDLFAVRSRIASRLSEIVRSIAVFPAGQLDERDALRAAGVRDREGFRYLMIEYGNDEVVRLRPLKGKPTELADYDFTYNEPESVG